VKVPPFGPPDANIAIVGEAPGGDEEREGLPFVGSSGRLLNSMLNAVGIDRRACYILNVMDIRPPRNDFSTFYSDGKTKRDPSERLIKGRGLLRERLSKANPNVIIALGNEPYAKEWEDELDSQSKTG